MYPRVAGVGSLGGSWRDVLTQSWSFGSLGSYRETSRVRDVSRKTFETTTNYHRPSGLRGEPVVVVSRVDGSPLKRKIVAFVKEFLFRRVLRDTCLDDFYLDRCPRLTPQALDFRRSGGLGSQGRWRV